MNLKPTNVPLTTRDFDTERCGVCAGCGCACGYIAYLRENTLVDLYGHPHDPNGIGSFCTKGITLVQEVPQNPLRLAQPLMRSGDEFVGTDAEGVFKWLKENFKGRVALFLDRFTDIKDYTAGASLTEDLYSDSVYLPFRASTLRPQDWREQRVILALECETVFSEVMSTRWLVDAFERSAHIVAVSSRFGTTSAKASRRILVKPPLVVKFLEELADTVEGGEGEGTFGEEILKLAKAFSLIKESLILIGDTLLRSRWRNNVLGALRRLRKKLKVNYAIVGNVSPLKTKELGSFLEEFANFDTLLLTGNPAMFMSEEQIEKLREKRVLSLSLFPTLTANSSDLVVPSKLFAEREFFSFRNGFGFVAYSPRTLPPPENSFSLHELVNENPDIEKTLSELGLSESSVKTAEGGADIQLPPIEEWDEELSAEEVKTEGVFLVCDSTLVDETGHWNVWTHEMEREQFAYMSKRTMEELGVGERVGLNGVELGVRTNNNVADGVIFVPSSYEQFQPFNPGVRPGRIMKNPAFRIEECG
ncbi:dehydrogenase [Hydrogenivirga sp.]